MRRLAAVLFVFSSVTLAAQPPARDRAALRPVAGSGVIRGRVVAQATGDPLRHAVVKIAGASGTIAPTLSDEEGRFEFATLPAGTFTLTAQKPGFAKSSAAVQLAAQESAVVPDVALPKGAVLTGVMTDDHGDPLPFAGVLLTRVTQKDGEPPRMAIVARTLTDDAGAFRFGSLGADTYVVNPTRSSNGVVFAGELGVEIPQGGRFQLPNAPRYVLQPGEERSGITLIGPSEMIMLPPAPTLSQLDPKATIVVRGRVTRSGGGPIANAVVQLLAAMPGPPMIVLTDAAGRYEAIAANRAEGDFRVTARKDAYAQTEYGARPNRRGQALHLVPGDTVENIDIALPKLSVIGGRILDDLGDPVEGALVGLAQLRYEDGQRKLVDSPLMSLRSDDLGRYRIFGLRPGQYAVVASVGQVVVTDASEEFPGYGTTYFPGTTNPAEIQLLSVGASQDINDLDFRLVRQKGYRISGHASDSAGEPVTGGISLTPRRRSNSIAARQMGARIDRDGGFEFLNVPPGDYVLQVARGMGRNQFSEGEFVYRFIDIVDADVTDLDMQTGLGSTITGRLTFEGGEPAFSGNMALMAMPVDLDRTPNGQTARARFHDEGTFELQRIHGPRRLQMTAPPGWTMKSVLVNGVDVTDEPIPFGREDQSLEDVEVVLTRQTTKMIGHVAEARDMTMTDLAVLAFSTRRDQWYLNTRYIRRTVVSSMGNFTLDGLPPDEYFVFVGYPPDDPGEWRDPESLEKLALNATRVRLPVGQSTAVELRTR